MEIRTQAELTANIDCGDVLEIVAAGVFSVVLVGASSPHIIVRDGVELTVEAWESSQPRVEARGSSQPRVVARESSQPRVVAWGSSQPRVEARGSSQPRVEARGSSQPRVVAWESSQPRVVAWGSSQPRVEAWGSSQPRVEAWESSQPRVEARGSSQPRVEARGSSQPRVVAWESSQPRVVAWGSSQPRVEAWGSSQPRVEAWESSQPRVEARGSSQPRVEARGSSQPRVEAWGSSQPRVEAWGYTQLSVRGSVQATCAANVSVLIDGGAAKVEGGRHVIVALSTAQEWCDYYGVEVRDGVACVYKAVGDDYHSPRRTSYAPGRTPIASDWDGGKEECGGGLHFSPTPKMARAFFPEATRFLACPVALADIAVHPDGIYPEKIKAKGCCAPTVEVDEDGEPLEVK